MAERTKINNDEKQEKEIDNSVEENVKIDVPSKPNHEKSMPVKDFQNEDKSNQKSYKKKSKSSLVLHEIPPEKLENFYKYQHFNMSLQQFKEEWDILAIFPYRKSVINIEVKLGPKKDGNKLNLLKEASKQANNHFLYFQKLFGFKLTDDWTFIKAACVPYLEIEEDATEPCKHCQIYVLNKTEISQKDLFTWIERLVDNNEEHTSKTDYENLVASIIGHSSLKEFARNGLIISPLDQSMKVETSITGKKPGISCDSEFHDAYLLNTEQNNAVHDKSSFLIIDGDYGTGKTFVLKERAKLCSKKLLNENSKEKIAYINFSGLSSELFVRDKFSKATTMDLMVENEFESYSNVEFISCKHLFTNYLISQEIIAVDQLDLTLHNFLNKKSFDHIFIDEMVPLKTLIAYPNLIKSCKTVSFAMKVSRNELASYNGWVIELQRKFDFKYISLEMNMRNSENVLNLSTAFFAGNNLKVLEPKKKIKGNCNYYYRNKLGLDKGILAAAAIRKYFTDDFTKVHDNVVVLVSETDTPEKIFNLLHNQFSSTRKVEYIDNANQVKEYLKKPEGIFVVGMESFQGAQARNVIMLIEDPNIYKESVRNIILRTMSFGIVILSGGFIEERKIPGIEQDKDLHEYLIPEKRRPFIVEYHNKFNLSSEILIGAIIKKYLGDLQESIFVITCSNYKDHTYRCLQRYISNLNIGMACYSVNSNDDINMIRNLQQDNPKHILFTDLGSSTEMDWIWDFITNTKHLIVLTEKSHEHHRIFISKCRTIIKNVNPNFTILLHQADIEEFYHPVYSHFLEIKEDVDLHEYIHYKETTASFYHYENNYKFDCSLLSLEVLKKYFKYKLEESLVIISSEDKDIFSQLEERVLAVSKDIVCHYFDEHQINESNDLMSKTGQIIYIKTDGLNFSCELFESLSSAKCIVVFINEKCVSNVDKLYKYKSECRNLMLKIRPNFALFIHNGDIKEFTGPADYPFLNMIEDSQLHLQECYHYQNKYILDEPTIISGVLTKYFKNKNEECIVILTKKNKTVFSQLKKKVSDVSRYFKCTYFQEDNLKNEKTKSELKDLLCKPGQIVFIQITQNQRHVFPHHLLMAQNIVIFFDEKLKICQILEFRNLILNIRPKFALIIHVGNIKRYYDCADYSILNMMKQDWYHYDYRYNYGEIFSYPYLNMNEVTDLHNNIQNIKQDCYHYQNIYNLDEPTIILGVLDKYFKDKYEESLVILTLVNETMFKQLEKRVSGISSKFKCTYLNELEYINENIEDANIKIMGLLNKPAQIIIIDIHYFYLNHALFDFFSLSKNAVVFTGKNVKLEHYNSECRKLILNMRAKFALVIHDGDIEEFTGPADYPFLNMTEVTHLHEHIAKHDCYHYQNIYKLNEPTIILGVLDKYFKDDESFVILTTKDRVMFKQFEKKVSNVSTNFVCTYFHQDNFESEDTKSELNDLLGKPGQIVFIAIDEFSSFSYALINIPLQSTNIVIFCDKYWLDEKDLRKYNSECINLILNIKPKFAVVVHGENIEEFTGPADYPLLNMIKDGHFHEQDCYHYQNKYILDEPTIISGVLTKYFKDEKEESLVIITIENEAVFAQIEKKVSDVLSHVVSTYFHQNSFENENSKRELTNLLHKPRQIIFIDIQSLNFSCALSDLLLLAKNIVIFSSNNCFSQQWINRYNLECRKLILNIRPKFAIVIHDGNIEEFTGTADQPYLNMIEDTNLHEHVNS